MTKFKKFDLSSEETVILNDEIEIPIPQGFHYCKPLDDGTGIRLLLIAPEDYSLDDDIMEAEVGISFTQMFAMNDMSDMKKVISHIFWDGFQIEQFLVNEIEFFVGYQSIIDPSDDTYSKVIALVVCTDNLDTYVVHAVYNHPGIPSDDPQIKESFESAVTDWLNEIKVPDESNSEFEVADPDPELYEYYIHRKNMSNIGRGLLNTVVITSSSMGGSDYQFIPLENMKHEITDEFRNYDDDEYDSDDGDNENILKRKYNELISEICYNDFDVTYDSAIYGNSIKYLFHVNKESFDCTHDRECEINEGYIYKAYMFSALRSFAWTLAKYCDDNYLEPSEVSIETLKKLISFIKSRNWLNFGDDFCEGLCSCHDIHVYFVPERFIGSLNEFVLPSPEQMMDDIKIKATFPSYSPNYSTVSSLENLRKDLDYISDAIETIYMYYSQKKRDRSKELVGDMADILYAWCSIAKAAEQAFFIEDGPRHFYFEQINLDK